MRIRNLCGYQTCACSMKRKQAPWRVSGGCENPARLFTGQHYELPNNTLCMTCRFYCRDKGVPEAEEEHR